MAVYDAEVRIIARSYVVANNEFLAGLRRGRPPYPRELYTEVAERAIKEYFDPSLKAFTKRYRGILKSLGMPEPGDTVCKDICRPVYRRTQGAKRS
jgi:hypothetical protein